MTPRNECSSSSDSLETAKSKRAWRRPRQLGGVALVCLAAMGAGMVGHEIAQAGQRPFKKSFLSEVHAAQNCLKEVKYRTKENNERITISLSKLSVQEQTDCGVSSLNDSDIILPNGTTIIPTQYSVELHSANELRAKQNEIIQKANKYANVYLALDLLMTSIFSVMGTAVSVGCMSQFRRAHQ